MPRAVVSIFALLVSAYPTEAAESCLNGQCHEEVSLMQIKTSVSMSHNVSKLVQEPAKDLHHVGSMLFAIDDPILLELLTRTTVTTTTCLPESNPTNHGGWDKCKEVDEDDPVIKPCTACIEDQWATSSQRTPGSGAGYQCCDNLNADALKRQPLCGICLRFKGGGLSGEASRKSDQSAFAKCAEFYCQLSDVSNPETISNSLLDNIAKWCSPENTQNTGPAPVEGMVALVANNPKKGELEEFLKGKTAEVNVITQSITGTASSSQMAMCVTGAKKAAFSTFSGPWGGDAQLAGLMAAQCRGGKQYLKAVVFFADEKEAHREDILALKNLMVKCKSHFETAFDADGGAKLIESLLNA